MKKYVVTGAMVRVHSGMLRLTPKQAEARIHGFPERLEALKSPDCYKVLRPVTFKNGEEFYYCGEPLGRDAQEVQERGLFHAISDKVTNFIGQNTKTEYHYVSANDAGPGSGSAVISPVTIETGTNPAADAPAGGLLPLMPMGAPEDKTAKDLFAEMGLAFPTGKSQLKKVCDFDVQNGATVVPADVIKKLKASSQEAT